MKTEVKKVDSTKREIHIEVSPEVVKNKFDDVFTRLGKEAKVAGFRPGSAPRDILEKHFSSQAQEQVLRELIPEVYRQAIENEKLDVIELPDIFDVKLEREILTFKARVEIAPEIKISRYRGINISYQKISVLDDEVKRSLDALKESRKLDDLDDGFARSLGYPDLAQLREAIQRQLYIQKENLQRQKIESEIIEKLMKDLDFKVPQSMVNRQLEELVKQAKVDMALKGLAPEKITEQENALNKDLEPVARNQVKIYLVLSEIAKKENIPLDEHMSRKVIELLFKEADWRIAS